MYKKGRDNALDSLDVEGGEVMECDNEDGFNSEEENVAGFTREIGKDMLLRKLLRRKLVEENGDDADWLEAQGQ